MTKKVVVTGGALAGLGLSLLAVAASGPRERMAKWAKEYCAQAVRGGVTTRPVSVPFERMKEGTRLRTGGQRMRLSVPPDLVELWSGSGDNGGPPWIVSVFLGNRTGKVRRFTIELDPDAEALDLVTWRPSRMLLGRISEKEDPNSELRTAAIALFAEPEERVFLRLISATLDDIRNAKSLQEAAWGCFGKEFQDSYRFPKRIDVADAGENRAYIVGPPSVPEGYVRLWVFDGRGAMLATITSRKQDLATALQIASTIQDIESEHGQQ